MPADDEYNTRKNSSAREAVIALNEIARLAHLAECAVSAQLPRPMTVAQYSVLKLLYSESRPLTITQLAETLDVSQPTMSSTVAKLQTRELVSIVTLPRDRRAKQVALTPKGKAMKETCDEHVEPMLKSVISQLPGQDWLSVQAMTADIARQFLAVVRPAGETSGRMR